MIESLRRLIRFYCHYSPFDRGKYRLATWAFQHLKYPSIVVPARLGKSLQVELDPSDLVSSQIYYIGYYELYLAKWFCKQIKPNMIFADVGAHVGQYTLLAAFNGAQVHAFEPYRDNFAFLERNVFLNSFSQVTLNQVAVSDQSGSTLFYPPDPSNTGSGSLQPDPAMSSQAITVPTITLDSYFAAIGAAPHFIKMDIEGAELLALRGAINTLRTHHPTLLLEASRVSAGAFGFSPKDLLEFLLGLGYRIFVFERNRLKPLVDVQLLDYENLICLPPHEHPPH